MHLIDFALISSLVLNSTLIIQRLSISSQVYNRKKRLLGRFALTCSHFPFLIDLKFFTLLQEKTYKQSLKSLFICL